MLFNKSADYIIRYIEERAKGPKLSLYSYVKIISLILLYILIIILLSSFHLSTELSGVLSQLQVIISVFLVISFSKLGYIIAVILNGISFFNITTRVLVLGIIKATPGILVSLSTIICITIIYLFVKRLTSHVNKLGKLNDDLMALYKDLAAAETQYWHQNRKIAEFSRIVEENQKQLDHLTFYDIATGLPNRKKVLNRLELLIQISEKKKLTFAVVFISLDELKHIRDTLGHEMGDVFLKTASTSLKNHIDARDLLGRLGDDEFMLLIQQKLSKNGIVRYVNHIRDTLNICLEHSGNNLPLSASFGIALYPKDGTETSALLKSADLAMCSAKNNGKDKIYFYSKDMWDKIEKKKIFEQKLLSSVSNNELYLVFQPLYHADSMQIRGFEALVRWNSPELGLVMPGAFIPVAEKNRYIITMGEWILWQGCHFLKQIQELSETDAILSVNISCVQLMSSGFVQSIKNVLKQTGLNSKSLELEVTESVMISSMEHATRILTEIKALGVRVSMDDFGTGFSSLNYMQMLPIDTLKMDKSFIAGATEHNGKYEIVGTIIKLAHQMNLTVVAEGIENEQQLNYLKQNGCDYLQGFLLSRPLEKHALTELFSKQQPIRHSS